jgi:site-specific recombinase XerD
MQKIEILLKERRLDKYARFNIYSIHVRYTLSLLLGTRDFGKSVDLGRISRKHKVIMIQEKGKETNTGFRCIPLSELAQTVIRNYLNTLEKFGIKTKAVVIFDGKNTVPLTLATMQKAFKEFNFYKKHMELYEMLNLVPLNLGRHLITSMATEAGILQDDMNAFMGHAVNGGELLGRFSMHDTQKYRNTFGTILNEIARIYRLKDIHEHAAL